MRYVPVISFKNDSENDVYVVGVYKNASTMIIG